MVSSFLLKTFLGVSCPHIQESMQGSYLDPAVVSDHVSDPAFVSSSAQLCSHLCALYMLFPVHPISTLHVQIQTWPYRLSSDISSTKLF